MIKDGYLHAPEGPGLGTRLKADVFDRSDVHVEETTEAYKWEAVGFVDPGQRVSHFFSQNVPEGQGE